MCGIAGYSLAPHSRLDRTLAAQALLAAIAERGTDAVGYAYPVVAGASGPAVVVKQQTPASQLLEQCRRARGDATSSSCTSATSRRAIRRSRPTTTRSGTGPSSGSTTGRIVNDDELLAAHACARAEPSMTVDSEAVFALAAHSRERRQGLRGARRLDGRRLARRAPAGRASTLARGVGRPLWLGDLAERHRLRLDGLRARGLRAATADRPSASARSATERCSRSGTAGSSAGSASGHRPGPRPTLARARRPRRARLLPEPARARSRPPARPSP